MPARDERIGTGGFDDDHLRRDAGGGQRHRVPGLISAGIFAFTLSWNEFIYALTFISSSETKTLPVGVVTELVEGDVYRWGPLMAGALFALLPVAFVCSFFVEYYVSGLTGAVKE